MNFFDYIKNESFFKPLTFKYRRIYYDCIRILIDRSKELPVLYESDAKDSITLYLKNEEIQRLIEEADDENEAVQLQAAEILAIFRECGWIKPRQIGRSGEYVVNLSTDCRRVIDFLDKLTEKKNEGTMSNRILSMYEIMKSASEEGSVRKERPYSNILVPMMENETELRNELADLKDSISDIMKTVIEFQDMNSFGQFIMKNEMLDRFFSEYFFVKNNGLIPTQLSFIRDRIEDLRYGDMYEKMVEECGKRLRCPKEQAISRVDRYMAELQYFLSVEYEENMELIDTRINSYYNLANTRIMQMEQPCQTGESSRRFPGPCFQDFKRRAGCGDGKSGKMYSCYQPEIRWLQIIRAESAYPQRRSEYRIKHQCDVGRRDAETDGESVPQCTEPICSGPCRSISG